MTLSIGGKEFINSSYGTGGTLNTLVLSLTRSQFLSLKNGAPVVVYYVEDNAAMPAAQWTLLTARPGPAGQRHDHCPAGPAGPAGDDGRVSGDTQHDGGGQDDDDGGG